MADRAASSATDVILSRGHGEIPRICDLFAVNDSRDARRLFRSNHVCLAEKKKRSAPIRDMPVYKRGSSSLSFSRTSVETAKGLVGRRRRRRRECKRERSSVHAPKLYADVLLFSLARFLSSLDAHGALLLYVRKKQEKKKTKTEKTKTNMYSLAEFLLQIIIVTEPRASRWHGHTEASRLFNRTTGLGKRERERATAGCHCTAHTR